MSQGTALFITHLDPGILWQLQKTGQEPNGPDPRLLESLPGHLFPDLVDLPLLVFPK
jgi:hypothetical protein